MLNIIHSILDIVFPPRTDELLIRNSTRKDLDTLYKPSVAHGVIALSNYEQPLTRALITENKFFENTTAATQLGILLDTWLTNEHGDTVLVPIPLSTKRRKERGYNQVEKIICTLPHVKSENLLIKIRDTVPQTSLSRTARLTNNIGVFSCPKPELLHNYGNKTLVLVDDVSTTGATLQVAKAALEPLLPTSTKLICLAIAH